ncbi:GATA-like protein [Mya arenaria]|uniref:GATA-like protein n=1 Tax=Mya arenaria TaxID=6604 RepID=A0ABY7EFA5_MYAAR|nr:GATA-like protein [Mya arenaria]
MTYVLANKLKLKNVYDVILKACYEEFFSDPSSLEKVSYFDRSLGLCVLLDDVFTDTDPDPDEDDLDELCELPLDDEDTLEDDFVDETDDDLEDLTDADGDNDKLLPNKSLLKILSPGPDFLDDEDFNDVLELDDFDEDLDDDDFEDEESPSLSEELDSDILVESTSTTRLLLTVIELFGFMHCNLSCALLEGLDTNIGSKEESREVILESEAVQQIKAGKISAKDLCEKCIERSSAVKELNAYVTNTHDDNFCTKNIRTTCSSHMLENYFPPYTATVVQRLFDNGAVMMGKTNMDEYAMGCGSIDSIHGPVRNPWRYRFRQKQADSTPEMRQEVTANKNEKTMHGTRNIHTSTGNQSVQEVKDMGEDDWFIAGGSSGGSAVAVATGTCFGALGSDTGGSVRNPASYCGVVGLKPSYGLVSRYGLIPLVNSLDVPGIFAKTVDDAALLLNTIAGHDVQDSTTVTDTFNPVSLEDEPSLQGLHIAIRNKQYNNKVCI